MRAYHFLQSNYRTFQGGEAPWRIGEKRTLPDDEEIRLCEWGYHSSPSWYDALAHATGPIACIVSISKPEESNESEQVSRSRKLVAAADASKALMFWACDCVAHVTSRAEIIDILDVVRQYYHGEASNDQLRKAAIAAATIVSTAWHIDSRNQDLPRTVLQATDCTGRATAIAASNASDPSELARAAARTAARAVAFTVEVTVAATTTAAEVAWQRQALAQRLDALFAQSAA